LKRINRFVIEENQSETTTNDCEAGYVDGGAVDREPTFGELAVGLSFNPSQLSDVDKVKRAFANLIDTCSDISTFTYLGNTLKGMAIRACIEAQMAVVKLVTFKEK
jgi:hypothetical protein